jgi:hypothetical protein
MDEIIFEYINQNSGLCCINIEPYCINYFLEKNDVLNLCVPASMKNVNLTVDKPHYENDSEWFQIWINTDEALEVLKVKINEELIEYGDVQDRYEELHVTFSGLNERELEQNIIFVDKLGSASKRDK